MNDKINKSDQEWKDALSNESYEVTRKAGTERPFTGKSVSYTHLTLPTTPYV